MGVTPTPPKVVEAKLKEIKDFLGSPMTRNEARKQFVPLTVNVNLAHSIMQLLIEYLEEKKLVNMEEFKVFCSGKYDIKTGALLKDLAKAGEIRCKTDGCGYTSSTLAIHNLCGMCTDHCKCEVDKDVSSM